MARMEPVIKTKNIKAVEAVLRCIIGIILAIFGFFIAGILRWVVLVMGMIFIATGASGY